jgi:hypothetical protein
MQNSLANRLSSPLIQVPTPTLLDRIAIPGLPPPAIDPPTVVIKNLENVLPELSPSDKVSLGTDDSPVETKKTSLGKCKVTASDKEEDAVPKVALPRPVPIPKKKVSAPVGIRINPRHSPPRQPTPRAASPLRDHCRPTWPIKLLDDIPPQVKIPPKAMPLRNVSGPVRKFLLLQLFLF